MILLLLLVVFAGPIRNESVDMIELHHMHDCNATYIYDQIIFWDWNESKNVYQVRAWRILTTDDRPTKRGSRWYISLSDQHLRRCFVSEHYRESWLQRDPERDDKKVHPEHERIALRR